MAFDDATASFFELMKEGSDSPGDDEEKDPGHAPDQYPDPKDSEDRKAKDPATGTAQHHSTGALAEFRRGREQFLKNHFDSYPNSRDTNQKVLSQMLDRAKKGDYDASTAMVLEGSKKNLPETGTLLSKTKRLLDEY